MILNDVRNTLNLLEEEILRATSPDSLRQSGWSEKARNFFERFLG